MSRRLFSEDPLVGITKWWEYDEATDTATIHTEQDVSKLCAHNQAAYNAHSGSERWGEWTRIASIPNTIYVELMQSGKLNDEKFMRNFLNSSEYRMFRTRPGKVSGKIGSG